MKYWFSLFLLLVCAAPNAIEAQPTVRYKKTLFQGFWWDYHNNNFNNKWANYLTELAPRLRSMGIDAIWIPPSVKNQDFGQKGVGYAPYDHYDLGDKFQKNDAFTRLGTKDELLRMIAVMHANGIEVIQDIVPNHVIGAGSDNGGGGQDPAAPVISCTDNWKNFRYSCYETPATNQSATDYWARKGRFPKNHQNFHPNPGNNCGSGLCDPNADPICWQGFGPDVSYAFGAHGYSSNATTFNPDQTTYSPYNNGGISSPNNGYMRKHTREWLLWYKKQTGFDGVRIDAVKHFETAASEDFLYNLQNTAGWANGTDTMLAVGEWVGGTSELDAWTSGVQNRSGTFDFNLRAFGTSNALYGMIYGNGGFDVGNLPGTQQNLRYVDIGGTSRIHRTVPFVNNHDTYRPTFDANGNITGWNTGSELSPHVDIREPRLAAAYAVACAVDGNPQIFFEDLFNIANTGKRWTHLPTNTTDLPVNSDLANIIKAHGALNFKGGDYKVPSNVSSFWNVVTSSNNNDDYLVIERSGKAIIGVTDQWNTDQEAWVDTDFPVGTVLVDYSGGIATTTTVQTPQTPGGPNRVNVKTRAVGWPSFSYQTNYADHGAHYHGYSIWAPQGLDLNSYVPPAMSTTQEWEMENDLGDSHCQSLTQGGRTPNNSPNARVVGKVFVEANTTVSYTVTLGSPGTSLTFEFYDLAGNRLHTTNGGGATITGSFANATTRWITAKVRNTASNTNGQKCWVRLTYKAPAVVSTASFPAANTVSIWTSNGNSRSWADCRNWEEGKVPTCSTTVVIPHAVKFMPSVDSCFTGTLLNYAGLTLRPKVFLNGPYNTATMRQNDHLRRTGLFPLPSPYNTMDTTDNTVLGRAGDNAIVDWVRLELRDKNNPAVILYTRSGLVQRDGDIVGTDGTSPVFFTGVANDNYYVAIRHRNHLGFRTNAAIALAENTYAPNFTNSISSVYGTVPTPLRLIDAANNIYVMYSADANGDGTVNSVDRNAHWRPQNGGVYNYSTSTADFNLDGAVNAVDRNAHWRVNNSIVQWLE